MILELNASDDRGIGIVRGQILNFASTRTIFCDTFKLIILDEADAMTNDAQNALRRIIEKYTDNVRFCIICNYLSKIIPALQSRCTRFRFAPLSPDKMIPRLDQIVQSEDIQITENGKKALLTLSKGDMRKVLNVLQSTAMAFDIVNEDNVYMCVGYPLRQDIENILKALLSGHNFEASFRNVVVAMCARGLALEDIITELHLIVMRLELPISIMNELIVKLAHIEERLAKGCTDIANTAALVSAFFICRDMVSLHKE
ncbi:replication factor C subunit 5 isoform X2 [Drosophila obscura]|nr:replication factor C subunit 5 isoform X2 [Drosophila obscura]